MSHPPQLYIKYSIYNTESRPRHGNQIEKKETLPFRFVQPLRLAHTQETPGLMDTLDTFAKNHRVPSYLFRVLDSIFPYFYMFIFSFSILLLLFSFDHCVCPWLRLFVLVWSTFHKSILLLRQYRSLRFGIEICLPADYIVIVALFFFSHSSFLSDNF